MNLNRELTPFQQLCEIALSAGLRSVGTTLISREIFGTNETYVRASVERSDLIVYIYKDEAQFHNASGLAGLYEHQDYADPDVLQQSFVSGVCAAFCEYEAANNSFKGMPLRGTP